MAPTLKQQLKILLQDFLYEKVLNHIKGQINSIAERNKSLTNNPHLCFVFKGETFAHFIKQGHIIPVRLHASLHKEMERVLKLRENVQAEMGYTMSFVCKVLAVSNDVGDYLGLLPTELHVPIKKAFRNCPQPNEVPKELVEDVLKYNERGVELIKSRLLNNVVM